MLSIPIPMCSLIMHLVIYSICQSYAIISNHIGIALRARLTVHVHCNVNIIHACQIKSIAAYGNATIYDVDKEI